MVDDVIVVEVEVKETAEMVDALSNVDAYAESASDWVSSEVGDRLFRLDIVLVLAFTEVTDPGITGGVVI